MVLPLTVYLTMRLLGPFNCVLQIITVTYILGIQIGGNYPMEYERPRGYPEPDMSTPEGRDMAKYLHELQRFSKHFRDLEDDDIDADLYEEVEEDDEEVYTLADGSIIRIPKDDTEENHHMSNQNIRTPLMGMPQQQEQRIAPPGMQPMQMAPPAQQRVGIPSMQQPMQQQTPQAQQQAQQQRMMQQQQQQQQQYQQRMLAQQQQLQEKQQMQARIAELEADNKRLDAAYLKEQSEKDKHMHEHFVQKAETEKLKKRIKEIDTTPLKEQTKALQGAKNIEVLRAQALIWGIFGEKGLKYINEGSTIPYSDIGDPEVLEKVYAIGPKLDPINDFDTIFSLLPIIEWDDSIDENTFQANFAKQKWLSLYQDFNQAGQPFMKHMAYMIDANASIAKHKEALLKAPLAEFSIGFQNGPGTVTPKLRRKKGHVIVKPCETANNTYVSGVINLNTSTAPVAEAPKPVPVVETQVAPKPVAPKPAPVVETQVAPKPKPATLHDGIADYEIGTVMTSAKSGNLNLDKPTAVVADEADANDAPGSDEFKLPIDDIPVRGDGYIDTVGINNLINLAKATGKPVPWIPKELYTSQICEGIAREDVPVGGMVPMTVSELGAFRAKILAAKKDNSSHDLVDNEPFGEARELPTSKSVIDKLAAINAGNGDSAFKEDKETEPEPEPVTKVTVTLPGKSEPEPELTVETDSIDLDDIVKEELAKYKAQLDAEVEAYKMKLEAQAKAKAEELGKELAAKRLKETVQQQREMLEETIANIETDIRQKVATEAGINNFIAEEAQKLAEYNTGSPERVLELEAKLDEADQKLAYMRNKMEDIEVADMRILELEKRIANMIDPDDSDGQIKQLRDSNARLHFRIQELEEMELDRKYEEEHDGEKRPEWAFDEEDPYL